MPHFQSWSPQPPAVQMLHAADDKALAKFASLPNRLQTFFPFFFFFHGLCQSQTEFIAPTSLQRTRECPAAGAALAGGIEMSGDPGSSRGGNLSLPEGFRRSRLPARLGEAGCLQLPRAPRGPGTSAGRFNSPTPRGGTGPAGVRRSRRSRAAGARAAAGQGRTGTGSPLPPAPAAGR